MPAPDVLTDVPGKPGRFWGEHTTFVGPETAACLAGEWIGHGLGVQPDRLPGGACGCSPAAARCHGVVTQGGASGMLFAWLQALCPWGRKPHVMIDCNWYLSGSRSARLAEEPAASRWPPRSVQRFVVWASHEVDDYAAAFGLPREKLEYVPFHTTLHDYDYEVRDDGYLFAGGNYDRDYATLIEAVRPLDVPVWIATTRPEQLAARTCRRTSASRVRPWPASARRWRPPGSWWCRCKRGCCIRAASRPA